MTSIVIRVLAVPLAAAAPLVALAGQAHAQLFNPTSRGGYAQVGASHATVVRVDPVGLTDWHYAGSVAYDGSGLPLPCSTAFAGVAVDTVSTSQSLTIALSGEVSAGGLVNDCGTAGDSRAVDAWDFFVTQPTCFTMTVTVDNRINTGGVQVDGAYLLIGYIDLTMGTLDAPSGIFRNFSSTTAGTTTFAGTLLGGGGYTVRISGQAGSQTNPASGVYQETLTLVLGGPTVTGQPADVVVCAGGPAAFSIAATGGANTYQWRRNDGPITLATNATAQSATLLIASTGGADAGSYTCAVTGPCGGVTSNPARLFVNSSDFDGDGDAGTDFDIQAFFACLGGNCCATCGVSDFNADGDFGTDADIESFFRVLGGGPC